MSTTAQPNVRAAVQEVADTFGYGGYTAQIERITESIQRTGLGPVEGHLRGAGVPDSRVREIVVALRTRLEEPSGEGEAPVSESLPTESFDRATAATVIREFITEGSRHGGSYTDEEVTALLVLAGLEDEPEPEPETSITEATEETEETDLRSVVERLVAFAQSHGFRL